MVDNLKGIMMKTLIKNGIGFFAPNYEVKPINILIIDGSISQVSEKEINITWRMLCALESVNILSGDEALIIINMATAPRGVVKLY